jgi:hypothetical protein
MNQKVKIILCLIATISILVGSIFVGHFFDVPSPFAENQT